MKLLLVPVMLFLIGWTLVPQSDTPQRYADLQAVTLKGRKVAYTELTSAQKSALWRYHLQRVMAQHSDLTIEQRDKITELSNTIGPEFFDAPASLGSLAMFSKRLGRELFVELAGPEPIAKSNHVTFSPDCSCSQTSDWCSTKCGGYTCLQSDSGCGTFWAYACTGICTGGAIPEDPPDH